MNKITKIVIAASSIYALGGCVVVVGANNIDADITLEQDLSLSASGIDTMRIDAGAGKLDIVGVEGLNEIEVRADIRTSDEVDYTLSLVKKGDTAVLIAKHDEYKGSWGSWSSNYPKIDVQVSVPAKLLLRVKDGSGDLTIKDIASDVFLDDGSGDAKVSNVEGDLNVEDGSGDLMISNVGKALKIDDGSGDLRISDIDGSLDIEDGSGGLTAKNVAGDIVVDDSSGDITITNAGGNLNLEDSSGDIVVTDASGDVVVDDSSGDIRVNGAESVHITDDGGGSTSFKNIRGNIRNDDS